MREFYEAFWADAPQDPEPYEWERRRALLLGEAQPGDRVLDLGCGAGHFLGLLHDAVGVEIAAAAAERARANVPGADVRVYHFRGTEHGRQTRPLLAPHDVPALDGDDLTARDGDAREESEPLDRALLHDRLRGAVREVRHDIQEPNAPRASSTIPVTSTAIATDSR